MHRGMLFMSTWMLGSSGGCIASAPCSSLTAIDQRDAGISLLITAEGALQEGRAPEGAEGELIDTFGRIRGDCTCARRQMIRRRIHALVKRGFATEPPLVNRPAGAPRSAPRSRPPP